MSSSAYIKHSTMHRVRLWLASKDDTSLGEGVGELVR